MGENKKLKKIFPDIAEVVLVVVANRRRERGFYV
jgi:hypothetical protein